MSPVEVQEIETTRHRSVVFPEATAGQLAFSDDMSVIAVAGTLCVWVAVGEGSPRAIGSVTSPTVSPDGRYVAAITF